MAGNLSGFCDCSDVMLLIEGEGHLSNNSAVYLNHNRSDINVRCHLKTFIF